MKCNNQNCPARDEPETACWEIAKREATYKDISNTCRDCIVYVLKEGTDSLAYKEIEKIINQREFSTKIEALLLDCSLRSITKK